MVRNKLNICKEYHIQPSEVDRVPYYEYEYWISEITDDKKEQEEENKKREQEQGKYKNPPKMPSIPSLPSAPKMPSIPQVSIPKF